MISRLLILLILILPFYSFAQKFYLSDYDTENGLASSVINAVHQDSAGQIWVGTDAGLHVFNGIEFKLVKRGIPSKYIRDIEEMDGGNFVVSHDAGLSFFKPGLDTVTIIDNFLDGGKDQGDLKYPNRLFHGPGNKLWISQPDGKLLRLGSGSVETILDEEKDTDQFDAHFSFAQINDTDFLFASTNGKLYLWNGRNDEIVPLGNFFPLEDIGFWNDRLYLAGDQLAVAKWNTSTKAVDMVWKMDPSDSRYRTLARDTLGRIYLGTEGNGLFQLIGQNSTFKLSEVYSNNDPHRVDRLPFRNIHSIYVSKDNALWISSEEGLGVLQRRFFEGTQNLPNDNATAISQAEDGSIFIAMGDVYRIRRSGQEYFAEKLDAPKVGVFNALAIRGSELWAGTNTGSIVQMNLNGGLEKLFPFSERGAGVFRACADSRGRKWFCQSPHEKPIIGLTMIDQEGVVHFYDETKGFENRMLTVREGPRGELFAAGIGAKSYLYKYVPDEDVFVNMSIPFNFVVSKNFEVHDIAIDERGLVWMATTDGLMRHDMESVIRPDLGNEYTGKEIRAVAVMPDKSLWLSTDTYGILRFQDGQVLSFGEDSGLPTKIMAYRGMLVDRDYKLWVNTLEGVVHTSQDMPRPFSTPEPTYTSLRYRGESLDPTIDPFDLTVKGELQMEFISLTYPGDLTTYQYRINQPIEVPWINLGNQTRVVIPIDKTDISGIEIRARKTGGHGWSQVNKIAIEASLPWYQRKTTHFFLAILGLALILIIWRASSKKYRRKIVDLESRLEDQNGHDSNELKIEESQTKHQNAAELQMDVAAGNLLYEVTEKTDAGMKWDHILEHLSLALLKLPNTVAFEIASLNKITNTFLIDGYSQDRNGFYQRKEHWSKTSSIFVEALRAQKVFCHHQTGHHQEAMIEWAGKFSTIITVPFFMGGKEDTVLCLYGNEKLDHEMVLKTMQCLANYMELLR